MTASRLLRSVSLGVSLLAVAALPLAAAQNAAPLPKVPASYKDIPFPPLPAVKLPRVTTFTLANGMHVMLMEDHDLPLVSGRVLVHTGNLLDPKDKVGLAGLTGEVMRDGGTTGKTPDQLNNELESIAASVETGINETYGSASFSCLKENTDQVLGDFADVLMHPAFREDKLQIDLMQERGGIARRNDSASGVASQQFHDRLYGNHTPYGAEEQYATLDNIHRSDLVRFYQHSFYPANVLLAVWGDFSTAAMRSQIEKTFGGWQNPADPDPVQFPTVEEVARPGLFVADRSDVNQTNIRIGHLGGELRSKDFPALEVMSQILGGGFSSRLFRQIRTNLGLAYSVGAYWDADFDHPGVFEISASTRSKSTVQAIQAILKEVNGIRTGPVTPEELKTAKDSVLNGFVFNFDTPSKTIGRMMTYRYYGYPENFVFQFHDAIEKVTAADVLRVAKQYLHPADFSIVVVGNESQYGTPLTALGLPIHKLDTSIPPDPKLTPKAAPVTAASAAAGKQVLARAIAAMGGPALLAVKDISDAETVRMQTPMGAMKLTASSQQILPSTLRQQMQLPQATIVMYTDGKSGWMHAPQGTRPLPPAQIASMEAELFADPITQLATSSDPHRTVTLTGTATVQGHKADVIVVHDDHGHQSELAIGAAGDPLSGLILRERHTEAGGPSGPVQSEEDFSDYRTIQQIRVPFHIVVLHNGKPSGDITATQYKVNTGLKPADLAQAPQS